MPGNPLRIAAAVCGIAGALIASMLWLYQQRPHSPLLGRYGYEVAHGGPLRDDRILVAALLGIVAVLSAILSSIGGTAKPSAMAGVLLGVFALTYPVMVWLDMIGTPSRVSLFPGT